MVSLEIKSNIVAPREGSVDRNWAEKTEYSVPQVAPREGSVDRNQFMAKEKAEAEWSLPARGAWIEMPMPLNRPAWCRVAPREGSVDRNNFQGALGAQAIGRSPRGERG